MSDIECDVCSNGATRHYCGDCMDDLINGYEEEIREFDEGVSDLRAKIDELIDQRDKLLDVCEYLLEEMSGISMAMKHAQAVVTRVRARR